MWLHTANERLCPIFSECAATNRIFHRIAPHVPAGVCLSCHREPRGVDRDRCECKPVFVSIFASAAFNAAAASVLVSGGELDGFTFVWFFR